jgi:archaellin
MINAIVEAQLIATFVLVAAAFASLLLNKEGN